MFVHFELSPNNTTNDRTCMDVVESMARTTTDVNEHIRTSGTTNADMLKHMLPNEALIGRTTWGLTHACQSLFTSLKLHIVVNRSQHYAHHIITPATAHAFKRRAYHQKMHIKRHETGRSQPKKHNSCVDVIISFLYTSSSSLSNLCCC